MMSLWDALRMNMMISYQELVRTFLSIADFYSANHPWGMVVGDVNRLGGNLNNL